MICRTTMRGQVKHKHPPSPPWNATATPPSVTPATEPGSSRRTSVSRKEPLTRRTSRDWIPAQGRDDGEVGGCRIKERWEFAATKTPPAPSGHPPHKGEGLAGATQSPNKRHPLRRAYQSRWHRGAKVRQNWRTGELENWRTGELENWRTGELEKNEAQGAAAIKPLPLVGRGWGGETRPLSSTFPCPPPAPANSGGHAQSRSAGWPRFRQALWHPV
jgi:Ni/Co efflux regulator RcnB